MPGARRCVIVTPEIDGTPTPVPEGLLRALGQHRVRTAHAPSAYHAIVRVASPHDDPAMIVLLLVEPESNPQAPDLALAAMTHAPDVSVWRYDADDESPIAPYVPHKPGVVPDPIEPLSDEDETDQDIDAPASHENEDRVDDDTPDTPLAQEELHLTDAPDLPAPESEPPPEPDTPLVSQDELDMLLGMPTGDRR